MKCILSLLFFAIVSIFSFISCNDKKFNNLQNQVDSLKITIENTYKPGLGEFMLAVQTHHAKLWFAGINKNWSLADFEVGEIKETLNNAIKFLPERSETKDIPMIFPVLDSLYADIKNENLAKFTTHFNALTKNCNECHHAVGFDFNKIKIPTSEPVSNQEFKQR